MHLYEALAALSWLLRAASWLRTPIYWHGVLHGGLQWKMLLKSPEVWAGLALPEVSLATKTFLRANRIMKLPKQTQTPCLPMLKILFWNEKSLGLKLWCWLYACSLVNSIMQNVNIIPIFCEWATESYWEGRYGPHPKLLSRLLVRAVYWKSSLHGQNMTASAKWKH